MHNNLKLKFAILKDASSSHSAIPNTLSIAPKEAKTPCVGTTNTPSTSAPHDSKVRKKRKGKFTLFSDHSSSLLRQQPGAAECDSSILTKGGDAEGTGHACHSQAGVLAARQYDERQGGP